MANCSSLADGKWIRHLVFSWISIGAPPAPWQEQAAEYIAQASPDFVEERVAADMERQTDGRPGASKNWTRSHTHSATSQYGFIPENA